MAHSGSRTGEPTFTGIARARRTSRRVAVMDRIARIAITGGGLLTIGAVALVCLFLLWVALPLLGSGDTTSLATTTRGSTAPLLRVGEDPYRRLGWLLQGDGELIAFATDDGHEIERTRLFDAAGVTSFAADGNRLLLGRSDGTVQFATIEFASSTIDAGADAGLAALRPGDVLVRGTQLFECTNEGMLRRQELRIHREEPTKFGDSAVVHADFTEAGSGLAVVAVTADGLLHTKVRSTRHDLLEDRDVVEYAGASLPLAGIAAGRDTAAPDHTLLVGRGDCVLLVWNDGRLLRLDTRDVEHPELAEEQRLVAPGRRITSLAFLTGKATLLVGDDAGGVAAWFRSRPDDATTPDRVVLVKAHTYAAAGSPVLTISPSSRSRLFVAGHADGTLRAWQGTSERLVAVAHGGDGSPIVAAAIAPKEDGILAATAAHLHRFDLRAGHAEATLATLFRPVWYEGAAAPAHAWQSTGGSDDFEPKLGLWPLIFGTLKATFYCLLLGVPLALLAAIYTSEFLHPRVRARVKPAIELMASLPSVVLGFLGGLVIAPFVADHLTTVLLSLFTVPFVFLAGAQVWQLAPPWLRPTADRLRVLAAFAAAPLGIWLASAIAPAWDAAFFRGDLRAWLAATLLPAGDPRRGSAFGGLLLLTVPLAALAVALLSGRLPRLGAFTATAARRFACAVPATAVVAILLAGLGTALGFDLRGNLFGVFDPRNSLVVGLVMGFAVVPIVYTIAEDALAAVPEHLRAASLGAGATPWQTAVRVVFPTALSGVFSAVMVGLGRAVGETMIVVMAVGGTAIVDPNVFNGFRTLAANIATELPEAVRDSTHYRVLYLAALCLFAMTFVLNTIAEVVRQRFRRRAFQL